jgi:hypothetical protein
MEPGHDDSRTTPRAGARNDAPGAYFGAIAWLSFPLCAEFVQKAIEERAW